MSEAVNYQELPIIVSFSGKSILVGAEAFPVPELQHDKFLALTWDPNRLPKVRLRVAVKDDADYSCADWELIAPYIQLWLDAKLRHEAKVAAGTLEAAEAKALAEAETDGINNELLSLANAKGAARVELDNTIHDLLQSVGPVLIAVSRQLGIDSRRVAELVSAHSTALDHYRNAFNEYEEFYRGSIPAADK